MKIAAAYKVTHLPTGLFYIGHTGDFKTRKIIHLSDLKRGKSCIDKMNVAFKPGDALEWTLYPAIDKAGALIIERHLINSSANCSLNCNQMHAGYVISDSHRQKLSTYAKTHPISAEASLKGRRARRNWECSSETKEKLRVANTGLIKSTSVRANMSKAKKDKPLSQVMRDKISKARSKPVTVGGVTYESTTIAARALNVSRQVIHYRSTRGM